MTKVSVNIFASVSTTIHLEEGETVDSVKERFVDIHLHGAGERGYENKTDLGAQHIFIAEKQANQSMVMVDKGLLLALLETARKNTDLEAVYDDDRGTIYPWSDLNKYVQGLDIQVDQQIGQ